MNDAALTEGLINTLYRPDGSRSLRPVHSIGIAATGYFEASPVAANFCVASHFNGDRIAVNTRFSNGSGCAIPHDGWSDVRGLATRFHLKDGSATDIVAMTLPEFFAPTPQSFLNFAKEAQPVPVIRQTPWQKFKSMLALTPPLPNPYPGETISPNPGAIAYANKHKNAQLGVFQAASIGAPQSYARASYHAVHTFVVTGPDGTQRWVRFTWQPVAGVLNTDPTATPVDDYLHEELRTRLAQAPARFSLMMVIGELGDAFDDSTKPWPPHRRRIQMGELTLNAVPQDQERESEKMSFNPCLLTDGIALSDDPVLRIRKQVYETSSAWRHATPCPFSGENT